MGRSQRSCIHSTNSHECREADDSRVAALVSHSRAHTRHLLKVSARHLWCLWKQKAQCPQRLLQGRPTGASQWGRPGAFFSRRRHSPEACMRASDSATAQRCHDLRVQPGFGEEDTGAMSELSRLVTNSQTWRPRWEWKRWGIALAA